MHQIVSTRAETSRRWWVLAIVVSAQFMFGVDAFIVNVAIPTIAAELHATPAQIEAVIAIYLIAYATLVVTGGRLGDIHGTRNVFIAGVAGFSVTSLWCGLAQSGPELIIARLAQGATAALMVPQVLATLHLLFSDAARARAFGIYGIVLGRAGAAGGMLGAIIIAMQKGIARGIFSNEAGLGSAPIAAAAAQTKEPVRQGLVSMTGTFLDTIVVCSMTGLAIVMTGAYNLPGLEGAAVTTAAFQAGLPFLPSEATAFVLMACLVLFGFTTILGWDYYGERCLEYFSNGNMKAVKAYRWLYIAAVFIGPYMTVSAVWTIADIFNGLMALPNMVALVALSGVVAKETRSYFARLKAANGVESAMAPRPDDAADWKAPKDPAAPAPAGLDDDLELEPSL